jgi:transposase
MDAFCLSSARNILERNSITRKTITRQNINRDEAEGVEFLERVMFIDPENWIDIDGCAQGKEDYFCRYGYSPKGKDCVVNQFVIADKTYSTMAAANCDGFLCWQIFDIPVTGEIFTAFVNDHLSRYVTPDSVAMLDNALIHKTMSSRRALERCFNGKYYYCAKYSPHLKPIEKCFALVKAHIRENEVEATLNPLNFINSAFKLFQIGGPRAGSIMGHWKEYFALHDHYNAMI